MDIPIQDAEMDIRADFDLGGTLQVSDVTSGAQEVRYVLEITSPAPTEKIRELVEMMERGCHAMNTIKNPTPVVGKVVHNGQEFDVTV